VIKDIFKKIMLFCPIIAFSISIITFLLAYNQYPFFYHNALIFLIVEFLMLISPILLGVILIEEIKELPITMLFIFCYLALFYIFVFLSFINYFIYFVGI
jgi:hypothetical protein